jgi:hypothetical protein
LNEILHPSIILLTNQYRGVIVSLAVKLELTRMSYTENYFD